jgi:histidinol phosphatase-like PHP family hydrolase
VSEPSLQLGEEHPATLPNHDLHNHTSYCGHAEEDSTVENLVARANELRLDWVGISEHLMEVADAVHVLQIQSDIARITGSNARVLFGVEMDVDSTDPLGGWVLPEFKCDYVILSAHGFPRFDLDIPDSERKLPIDLQRRNLARKWLQWYANAISRPGIHVLGHPLREPISMGLIPLQDVELFEDVADAFVPAIGHGVAFELNNAFLSNLSGTYQFPGYIKLIRALKARGMKFSRGSDSHCLANLGACGSIGHAADEAGLTASDWYDPQVLFR